MYSPPYAITIPPMVSAFTFQIGWVTRTYAPSAPSSAVWPATGLAVYFPIVLSSGCVARRMWWANGSSVSASYNIEAGIYLDSGYGPGAKLISAAAAQGTASQVQFVDITDTAIAPGLIWLALSCSDSSATIMRSAATLGDAGWAFSEASAYPLPAAATPAEMTSGMIALFGFATTASP